MDHRVRLVFDQKYRYQRHKWCCLGLMCNCLDNFCNSPRMIFQTRGGFKLIARVASLVLVMRGKALLDLPAIFASKDMMKLIRVYQAEKQRIRL